MSTCSWYGGNYEKTLVVSKTYSTPLQSSHVPHSVRYVINLSIVVLPLIVLDTPSNTERVISLRTLDMLYVA